MRGSPAIAGYNSTNLWIIPAHAGLTYAYNPPASGIRDHPRACGAHQKLGFEVTPDMGSSPRMRGSPVCASCFSSVAGIIPAHAGLTCPRTLDAAGGGDHPRACGAHFLRKIKKVLDKGSSPRMRGSRKDELVELAKGGIIPAHAGLTKVCIAETDQTRDHPRACGAHAFLLSRFLPTLGSSPRMRGSLYLAAVSYLGRGIIPAHAGLTRVVHSSCAR